MLYNLRHSAAAARFLVTLSCDGRGVEGEANTGDQETRERESDEQQKKAPSEMGKTGLGLKKMRREEGKEGGQSLSLSLSLSLARSKRCGQSSRTRTGSRGAWQRR